MTTVTINEDAALTPKETLGTFVAGAAVASIAIVAFKIYQGRKARLYWKHVSNTPKKD
jgi:hypothetical protein